MSSATSKSVQAGWQLAWLTTRAEARALPRSVHERGRRLLVLYNNIQVHYLLPIHVYALRRAKFYVKRCSNQHEKNWFQHFYVMMIIQVQRFLQLQWLFDLTPHLGI